MGAMAGWVCPYGGCTPMVGVPLWGPRQGGCAPMGAMAWWVYPYGGHGMVGVPLWGPWHGGWSLTWLP